MVCQDMKKIGLLDILNALEKLEPEIKVPDEIRIKAKKAVDHMLAIPKLV
ncbi:quinolinate synthase NadA [Thermodesulfobacteriota bacterium]